MAEYDNLCKILAETYPRDFARWLLNQEPQQIEILKTELSIEPIRADSVIFIRTENRILHIEFQTTIKSKTPISLRMLDYYVRLTRKYQVPVTQVVVFLQETDDPIAFTEEYVSEVTTHRFRVIRMWEQDSALFLDNNALLPLAPLCRTNSAQALLSQVAGEIAKIPDMETRQNTAVYTEILAGLRFEKNFIRQLLSEDIMQESVIYQDIVQKEAFKVVNRLLNRRFSQITIAMIERVQALSAQQLEDLAEALLDFSNLADLEAWLNGQERS
jgi:predicted transposase YdaD